MQEVEKAAAAFHSLLWCIDFYLSDTCMSKNKEKLGVHLNGVTINTFEEYKHF